MLLVTFSILGVLSMSIKSLVDISSVTNNATSCGNDSMHVLHGECKPCSPNSWMCKADFIFAILLLVNLGMPVLYVCVCVYSVCVCVSVCV